MTILAALLPGSGLWLLAGALAVDCPSPGGWPLESFDEDACPQVYRIQGTAPVEKALNIVVIADAFTEGELDRFRCAAGLMMEKVAASTPFNEYSDSINVFRIDLAASASGVEFPAYPPGCGGRKCHNPPVKWPNQEQQCSDLAARTELPLPLLGRPVYPEADRRPECLEVDIDARACPTTAQECQVLWPEGEGLRRLWRIAACAPAFDIVIVLANSGAWAGGGTNDLHPPLALATLTGISREGTRSRLLIHELGHALGLLDEYALSQAFSGGNKRLPPFHHGRNLVQAEAGSLPESVPWAHLCTKGVAGLETYAQGECFVVCSSDGCDLPDLHKSPAVGLIEGGFYQSRGIFRPSQICAMQRPEEPLCPACGFFVKGLFEDLGMKPNAGVPVSTESPQATSPSP